MKVTAPPPQQEDQPPLPLPPRVPAPLPQPEDQANPSITTDEFPVSHHEVRGVQEVQEMQIEKPKKAKVERIRIRLRPETPPDPDVQHPTLPLQDDGAKPHIQSHTFQDSRAGYGESPWPAVPITSKTQEQFSGDWVNNTPLTGQTSASGPTQGASHDEVPPYDLPQLWSGFPSLSAIPTSPELQRHREKQRREAMKEKESEDSPEATSKEQTESDPLWLSRQELVLKLERMTDARLQDMDRRVRSLERHDETWSQSVVPLMQNLNNLLEKQNRLLQSQNHTLSQSLSQGPELLLSSSSQRRSRRQPRESDPLMNTITPSPSPPAPGEPGSSSCRRAHTISGEQFRPHRRRSSSSFGARRRIADSSSDTYNGDGDGERSQSPTLTEQSQGPSPPDTGVLQGGEEGCHEGIVERRRTELEERIGRTPPGTGAAIKPAVEATVASLTQRQRRQPEHHHHHHQHRRRHQQQKQQHQEWRAERGKMGESSRGSDDRPAARDRSRSGSAASSSHSQGNTSTSSIYSNDVSEDILVPHDTDGNRASYDRVAIEDGLVGEHGIL
ncbi:hypothetical protein SLS62_005488 [Diatrype stigma]|uniref:Uncharacterized protein n=1 Tax=Diatrype stigma TaxID=117547 RepID=A0AAN9UPK0_9PEZI